MIGWNCLLVVFLQSFIHLSSYHLLFTENDAESLELIVSDQRKTANGMHHLEETFISRNIVCLGNRNPILFPIWSTIDGNGVDAFLRHDGY
jgi:hypothetical protein